MFHNKSPIKVGKVLHAMQCTAKLVEDSIDILIDSLGRDEDSEEKMRKRRNSKINRTFK